ncbi:MAG TPA: hypothetical protein VFL86_09480 [Burkholderiaceae bacterium]|nr:hypothetical protein [Burkholderiaceae bacterium]
MASEQRQGKPAVLVSGAGVNGSMTAAKLSNLGANVLVAEKRAGFSRQNILGLKEEALYTMANISPEGKLLGDMVDAHQINFRKSRIAEVSGVPMQAAAPDYRFGDWLLPATNGDSLPPMIPVRTTAPPQGPPAVDLPLRTPATTGSREPLEHLDLAWPNHEVVRAVAPGDWRYENLAALSESTLAVAQTRDLEAGLNAFCAGKAGIDIVQAEVDIKDAGEHYQAEFMLGTQRIASPLNFDLIHIAEGSRGKNARAFGERLQVDTGETWHQRHFTAEPGLNAGSSLLRSRGNPEKMPLIPIRFNRSSDTVISIAHCTSRSEDAASVWTRTAPRTQAVLKAAGSQARADDPSIVEYDSGRIDVVWSRHTAPADRNIAAGGDAAATGSPSAGAGASLAASAYPEMTQRLFEHPGFRDPARRAEANAAYNSQAALVADIWHDRSAKLMKSLGMLSPDSLRRIRALSGTTRPLQPADTAGPQADHRSPSSRS